MIVRQMLLVTGNWDWWLGNAMLLFLTAAECSNESGTQTILYSR